MDIKKTKKIMLREKEEMFLRYKVTEEYLVKRIPEGEEDKKEELIECRKTIKELENIIEFLKI